jgi:hypothetical protein
MQIKMDGLCKRVCHNMNTLKQIFDYELIIYLAELF